MNNWDSETAEWYAKKYGDYATNQLGVAALDLNRDAVVVDIGCGTGCALRNASERVTEGVLIGIDPIDRMLEIAIEQTKGHSAEDRIEYRKAKADELPVEDWSVDFVLAFDSLDHWDNQVSGLKEVRRILKSTGQFVVIKDGGLPNGNKTREQFLSNLKEAGLMVVKENLITESDVNFTMWICAHKRAE